MKKLVLGSIAFTTLAGTALMAFSLSENVNAILTANASIRYDDNIQQQPTGPGKIDDTIFELDPGIELTNSNNAQLKLSLNFTEALTRYANTSGLNTDLAIFNLTGKFDNKVNKAGLNAGFRQVNQNTPLSGTPGLLRRDETTLGANGEFELNAKSKLGVGVDYAKTDYKVAGLVDSEIYTVPINYFFVWTPKLDGSVGFRYRKTNLAAPATDYTDYYYSVGMRGEFNPKLHGDFSVGLGQHRGQVVAGGNSSSVGLDSSFTYDSTPKTRYTLGLSNDFGVASAGQSQQRMTLSGGVQTELDTAVQGFANVNYNVINYAGPRKDNYWEASIGAAWSLSRTWSLRGTYKYSNNSSNAPLSDFANNVIAITVSARY